jgi:hypothetical protein
LDPEIFAIEFVTEVDGEIVGAIFYTHSEVVTEENDVYKSLPEKEKRNINRVKENIKLHQASLVMGKAKV